MKALEIKELEVPSRDTSQSVPSFERVRDLSDLASDQSRNGQSGRDCISIIALTAVLQEDPSTEMKRRVAAFLIHLTLLRHLALADRACDPVLLHQNNHDKALDHRFFSLFTKTAIHLVEQWSEPQPVDLHWDVFDLVDGRLFQGSMERLTTGGLDGKLIAAANRLAKQIETLSGVDVSEYCDHTSSGHGSAKTSSASHDLPSTAASVLPFHHEMLSNLLEGVHLKTEEGTITERRSGIFQELTHWHNHKVPIDPKRPPRPQTWYELRRKQRFMNEILNYSASLTNAAGKILQPETIVVQTPASSSKKAGKQAADQGGSRIANLKKGTHKGQQKGGQSKSGRDMAFETARSIQINKIQDKTKAVVANWNENSTLIRKEGDGIMQYTAAVKLLSGLPVLDVKMIMPEATIYCASILASYWLKLKQKQKRSLYGMYLGVCPYVERS